MKFGWGNEKIKGSIRPVKKSDTRAKEYIKQFGSNCWELDALPPLEIQNLVVESIKEYIDFDTWNDKFGEEKEGKSWIIKQLEEIKEKLR